MLYIFLVICILIHSLIGVVFKYFEKHRINNLHAILVNYLVCILVAWIFFGEFPIGLDSVNKPWFPYAFGLGFFLIGGFTISALCFQYMGLAFTIVIQKMSLIIPVLVAIIIFDESAGWLKLTGIVAALTSIILINFPIKFKQKIDKKAQMLLIWIPMLTFIIGGIIESALLIVNEKDILKGDDVNFVASLFLMAGMLGLLFSLVSRFFTKRPAWRRQDVYGGIILGSFNFFSIYLLLWLLKNGMDGSIMYPLNNIGVVALSAIIGYIVFREKLNQWKMAGLAFSFIAIILILLAETS